MVIVIGAFALSAVSCTFGFVMAAVLSVAGRAEFEFENELLRQRLDDELTWSPRSPYRYPETER
jgi:hypothetical protein